MIIEQIESLQRAVDRAIERAKQAEADNRILREEREDARKNFQAELEKRRKAEAELAETRRYLSAAVVQASWFHREYDVQLNLRKKAETELAALRAERAVDIRYMDECKAERDRLVSTLETIAACGKDGICPYGCDTPNIAKKALEGEP